MTKSDEIELFDYLSRQPKMREWLNNKLDVDIKVLKQQIDIDQLRRAQGRCGLLDEMIALLNVAPDALKKRQ